MAIHVMRVLLRWTQKDLADAIGIGTSSISDWETGKVIPRPNSVERVLKGMKLKPAALDRTLGYIHEMRGAFGGKPYPKTAPEGDDIREVSSGVTVLDPTTRMEIDTMSRMISELSRRFLETHFGLLEQRGKDDERPPEATG